MERLRGVGFFVLCFAVSLIAGIALVLMKSRFQLFWHGLGKKRRAVFVCAAVAIVLLTSFVWNHGRPNEGLNNFAIVGCTVIALLLWALYGLLSRFLDAVWTHFANR